MKNLSEKYSNLIASQRGKNSLPLQAYAKPMFVWVLAVFVVWGLIITLALALDARKPEPVALNETHTVSGSAGLTVPDPAPVACGSSNSFGCGSDGNTPLVGLLPSTVSGSAGLTAPNPMTAEPMHAPVIVPVPVPAPSVDETDISHQSAELVTAEPVTAEPVTTEPVTTEPVTTEPVTTEPVDETYVTLWASCPDGIDVLTDYMRGECAIGAYNFINKDVLFPTAGSSAYWYCPASVPDRTDGSCGVAVFNAPKVGEVK